VDPHEEGEGAAKLLPAADWSAGRGTADDEGDRSLIRWMLSLTPAERLELLQRQVEAIAALRAGN